MTSKILLSMLQGEGFEYINQLGRQGTPFLCIIDFKATKIQVWPLDELSPGEIHYFIQGKTNVTTETSEQPLQQWDKQPLAFIHYQEAFEKVQYHLKRGDSFLINLTCQTPVSTNLELAELFHISQAKYKVWMKNQFVSFSPEPFVQIKNGIISSYPMKGTISASEANAPKRILEDSKELEEHYTIVDLIRNDLSRVAQKVTVEQFRYLELIKTSHVDLWQVSSKIKGILADGYWSRLGDILKELLPAGSISGAPKKRTLEIIEEVEDYQRQYFTGIVGLFDGESFDSGVMIRFVEQNDQGLLFKSGGGITVNSDVWKEYQEMIDKVYVPTI